MRILHTADWHLTERLKLVDRQPDIAARMEEIAGYLDEHKVDVMLIAGDMFSQYTRMDDLERAMSDVNRIFKPFLLRGGTMVAISGNHDNEYFFSMLRMMLDLATPLDPRLPGPRPGGRLYVAAQPTVLELADRTGQSVQFALLPYPTSKRYLSDEQTKYRNLAEKHRLLHDKFWSKFADMRRLLKEHLYTVMVTHIHVHGSQLHTPHHASESDDIIYEVGDIPTNWAYIACGHIHKPQAIGGMPHVRYSGSIERLNYGERCDEKSVVLIDIGPHGRQEEPVCLPLKATPFYRVEILNPEIDMQGLRERYPDAERALVAYRLVYKPGEHNPSALAQELKEIFPHVYDALIEPEGSILLTGDIESTAPLRDVPGTVESYVQERLADHPDREDVLRLARELLATVE